MDNFAILITIVKYQLIAVLIQNVFLEVYAIMVKNLLMTTVILILNVWLDVVLEGNVHILKNAFKNVKRIQIAKLNVVHSVSVPPQAHVSTGK